MGKYNPKHIFFLVAIALPLFYVAITYQDTFFHANDYIFNPNGDGVKNYFTYAGHANESSVVHCGLMNYPYGENFLYLDCHPVLAVFIQKVSNIFPGIVNYSVGIINFAMLFAIVLSVLFLYLIFIELKVKHWYSALSAFSIAVLAPQIFRIGGHYALSYSFCIPLTWYLFIKYVHGKLLRWSVLNALNTLGWFFVHAYLGMMTISFLLLNFVFWFCFNLKNRRELRGVLVNFGIQVLLPTIVFYAFAIISDTHIGRTDNPYGYLDYTSNPSSVIFPAFPPLRPLLNQIFTIEQKWEGLAYVGVASTIIFFIFIFQILKNVKKASRLRDVSVDKSVMVSGLLSGFLLLALSFGLPFKLHLEILLEKIPIIKNFRGIGRFAWVFYYTMTVFAVYFAHYLVIKSEQKWKWILALLIPISFFIEGNPYHQSIKKGIAQTPNYFRYKNLPEDYKTALQTIDTSEYQAILPLPLYHVGSENFGVQGTDNIKFVSMLLAFQTGMPILSNYSTRTSVPESKKIVELASYYFYKKNIKNDISSRKPFLVVVNDDELLPPEKGILTRSRLLGSYKEFKLYSIEYDSLFVNTAINEIENFQKEESLVESSGFLVALKDTSTFIYYNSFEGRKSKYAFRGKGAYFGKMKDYSELDSLNISLFEQGKTYTLSLWMRNENDNFGIDALKSRVIVEWVNADGSRQWKASMEPFRSYIINDDWTMAAVDFTVADTSGYIAILNKGQDYVEDEFYIDDILIREKKVDVYKVLQRDGEVIEELFRNNHRIVRAK